MTSSSTKAKRVFFEYVVSWFETTHETLPVSVRQLFTPHPGNNDAANIADAERRAAELGGRVRSYYVADVTRDAPESLYVEVVFPEVEKAEGE